MYRIFIVEDDYTIAGVLQRHLSAWGCEVRCAQNFQDILPEFQDFAPHLVLNCLRGDNCIIIHMVFIDAGDGKL